MYKNSRLMYFSGDLHLGPLGDHQSGDLSFESKASLSQSPACSASAPALCPCPLMLPDIGDPDWDYLCSECLPAQEV